METTTIIDRLLAEQRMLTAVERFARRHDRASATPAQARYYRDLIPLTAPGPGQQYAFEVDLDKCSGCKACVTACHSLNGLEETESWRSVGWLYGGDTIRPYQQTVTTACHHCADPGCLNGCPVLAYEKDPITGIVRHLDDQCIGCQYCVWKCPYEVPRYSARLGVVRKCDMCQSRLASGEAPACVQSCPNEAIRIVHRSREAIDQLSVSPATLVPGSPPSALTRPATVYLNQKPFPGNTRRADEDVVHPEPAHGPLVLMLVLTQWGVGWLAAGLAWRWQAPEADAAWLRFMIIPALLLSLLGLAASGTHLGQPLRAWRIFLGWRRSWLSREAMIFGAYGAYAGAWLFYAWWNQSPASAWIQAGAVFLGLIGVASSIMIYHDTGRVFWKGKHTAPRFLGTTVLLGAASALASMIWAGRAPGPVYAWGLIGLTLVVGAAKLAREIQFLTKQWPERKQVYRDSARLLRTTLRGAWMARAACSLAGLALISCLLVPQGSSSWHAGVSLAALIALALGEFGERYLFFRAVSLPRMPGGLP